MSASEPSPSAASTAVPAAERTDASGATVLVTGGSGFLGRWCILELLRRGHRVRTTVRDEARERELRTTLSASSIPDERLAFFRADLDGEEGWAQAAAGCEYILHVASPFPAAQPKDPDEVIVPAREGTLRVLRAGLQASVSRIVVTSSAAAVRNAGREAPARALTEEDWTDADNPQLTPYARSKTVAERAAWDHMGSVGETSRLAVVNPSAIVGPLLGQHRSYSLQAVERLLAGSMPAIPRLGFSFIDVRDVADLHIRAMTAPAAGGQRLLAAGPFLWLSQVGELLRSELGADAARVPKRVAPSWLVRLLARFDGSLRSVTGELDKKVEYSTAKARGLGWTPRPIEQSIVECARSILADGAHA